MYYIRPTIVKPHPSGQYLPYSPYNYCGNDPVNFVDPDGRERIVTRDESTNIITISAIYLYDEKVFNNAVRKAVELLNAQKCHTYNDPKTNKIYQVRFQLSAYDINSKSANNVKYSLGTNYINKRDELKQDSQGRYITGGTPNNPPFKQFEVYKYSVSNVFTIAHEMIHTLGGNNNINGKDRHASEGLMVQCDPADENIYQGTINDIIEKGFGPNKTTGRLKSLIDKVINL